MSINKSPPDASIDAFLLTRQWRDTSKGIVLDFWFYSHAGPVHVLIENQQAIFFIRQEDVEQLKRVLFSFSDMLIKSLDLQDFEHRPVSAIYFTSQHDLYQARALLQDAQIRHYEADIRPVERFLTERFITGAVQIKSVSRQFKANDVNAQNSAQLMINPRIRPLKNSIKYQPALKIISLDIETAYDSQALYSISLLGAHWHITLMIGAIDDRQTQALNNTQHIEFFDHEKALMLRFIELIIEQDPDVIIGWNVINFDFLFLQKKADSLKISLSIGRSESLPMWRKAQTEQEHYFLLIPGRVVLDGIDTLKNATLNFPSFSLQSVAGELLGRGKLIGNAHADKQKSRQKNFDPLAAAKEIKRRFNEDKLSLAAYNLEDCQLVWDIFAHMDLLAFAIERAKLTGLEMDRAGGSVAAFDNLYLPRLHRMAYVAPNLMDRTETISAPGGYVMNSKPGLYNSVLVLDYKSLYPSIIRTFCVDPYARVKAETLDKKDCVSGFNGVSFSREGAILPQIIRSLWQSRDKAKKDNNKTLSQAIKIIMNSFYGVLGTPGCRVHDARLTSSITLRGHEIMIKTAELIEAEGYVVIYGDTDSVFVSLGNDSRSYSTKDNEIADNIGQSLIDKINQYWHQILRDKYQLSSFLEMEYETHYSRFFMPTIRGSDKGSKKRYAGMIADSHKEGRIVFKGLESVRTDWTALSREVQQEIYQRIFNDQSYEDYLKNIIVRLRQGEFDDKLIYRKRLRQKLSEYKKNRPPHAQAAMKAESYAKQQNNPADRYQYGGWIEYVMTITGPEPVEYNVSSLDYDHYIEKQIAPVVDALLMVLDSSLDKIIQAQYELF